MPRTSSGTGVGHFGCGGNISLFGVVEDFHTDQCIELATLQETGDKSVTEYVIKFSVKSMFPKG